MKTDKELIRSKQYHEALGDNYCEKPIYIMLFEDGECIEQYKERFEYLSEALEWIQANKEPLNENQHYNFGNINHKWL